MFNAVSAIEIKVRRFDPENPETNKIHTFTVETEEPLSVMSVLAKIHEIDASFACRTSTCFKGQCGSCMVRVNGRDVLGCVTMIKPGESVVLEPHSKYRAARDVVVDFSQPLED